MPKQFHNVRSAKKMLSYGAQNRIGPFRKHPSKKKPLANSQTLVNLETEELKKVGQKKTAPGATNTEDGKADKKGTKTI